MDNEQQKDFESVLQMRHVVFDELSFERNGFQQDNQETKFEFGTNIRKEADGKYQVSLRVSAIRQDEYTAKVQITGYFSIDEENEDKEILLKQNAVAILFPFVRSEFTLLTAQPEMTPLILPILNIAQMMQEAEEIEEEIGTAEE